MAACSPGIPCTGYDITVDTTSNVGSAFNGPKTGRPLTAGGHTGGACDGDFMNQIHARAFLEANRDVIMSGQIIRKPDSVLEYTCFEDLVETTAQTADEIFSAIQDGTSGDFVNRNVALLTASEDGTIDISDYSCTTAPCVSYSVVFPATQLDNILANVVLGPLNAYINHTAAPDDGNFDHNFRGGSSTIDSDVTTLDYPYNCAHMQAVWDEANCIDFGEEDQFRSFQQLAESDPRNLPVVCAPGPAATNLSDNPGSAVTSFNAGNVSPMASVSDVNIAFPINYTEPCDLTDTQTPATDITEDIIHVSNNCGYTYARFDILETHFDIIKSPSSTNAPGDTNANEAVGHPTSGCSTPIPTGVPVVTYTTGAPVLSSGIRVYQTQRNLHYDHVCVNPGCHYVPVPVTWPYTTTALPTVSSSGTCEPL
ncbi:MAG: hypothetical protein OEY94_00970 [Alphaproteobacteria bacterium]|nr:hypothetical protein [Alphaproteobacteria bacterium]